MRQGTIIVYAVTQYYLNQVLNLTQEVDGQVFMNLQTVVVFAN